MLTLGVNRAIQDHFNLRHSIIGKILCTGFTVGAGQLIITPADFIRTRMLINNQSFVATMKQVFKQNHYKYVFAGGPFRFLMVLANATAYFVVADTLIDSIDAHFKSEEKKSSDTSAG